MAVGAADEPLTIGLVNNMPDAAFWSTEKQFIRLLSSAEALLFRLRRFTLPEIPRSPAVAAYVTEHYEDIGVLWDDHLDGLIVTGTQPRQPNLTDEPYWRTLSRLVAWAEDRTYSSIWSCLAAHAAVRCLDGIDRQLLPRKLSGLYECAIAGDDGLMAFLPGHWQIPHSRYNGLQEDALTARGYQILSRSPETGPEMFVKRQNSLFVFLQGHPEYDRRSLLLEYRRDVVRFLSGQAALYPEIPENYLDTRSEAILLAFRMRVETRRSPHLVGEFPDLEGLTVSGSWDGAGCAIYRSWLHHIASRRSADRRGADAQPLTPDFAAQSAPGRVAADLLSRVGVGTPR